MSFHMKIKYHMFIYLLVMKWHVLNQQRIKCFCCVSGMCVVHGACASNVMGNEMQS